MTEREVKVANGYDEALSGAASKRNIMNTEALKANVAAPKAGTLVPKKNTAAGDPTVQPKPDRKPVMTSASERLGAAYGVSVNYTASTSPEAGATQANGRVFKSAINRDRSNFDSGNSTSY